MSPAGIGLLHPAWLWLLPALALLAWLWRRRAPARDDSGLAAAAPHTGIQLVHPLITLLPAQAPIPGRGQWLHRTAVWLSLSCLVVALSEPVRSGEVLPEPPEARDIVLIVDTSVSMVLRDYLLDGERVDRMRVLKGLLDPFIRQLRGARVSVIVFAGNAHTLVPLTDDRDLVRSMIARLRTGMAGRYSALGEAVALAVKEVGTQPQRRRILVLLTAADHPTGDITPEAAAELAAAAGLPLYTIGIGATEFAAEEKRLAGLIYQPVDMALLQRLAAATGARSFLASDTAALRRAMEEINRRETSAVAMPPRQRQEPLYHWPLLLGLLLLSLGQLSRLLGRRAP